MSCEGKRNIVMLFDKGAVPNAIIERVGSHLYKEHGICTTLIVGYCREPLTIWDLDKLEAGELEKLVAVLREHASDSLLSHITAFVRK
jgi:hypothetical protein